MYITHAKSCIKHETFSLKIKKKQVFFIYIRDFSVRLASIVSMLMTEKMHTGYVAVCTIVV
jgi:hypothetical protein